MHNLAGSTAEATEQHFTLVRALQGAVDGDGTPDLNGSRIPLLGQSLFPTVMWGPGNVKPIGSSSTAS